MTKGYFSFTLHSHLPWVLGHGVWPHGTDWLNEAAAETYIPLLNVFNKLVQDGIQPKVTIGITPVLAEQLASSVFIDGFAAYLGRKIEAAKENVEEFKYLDDEGRVLLARRWIDHFEALSRDFEERYGRDIIGAFRSLQDAGAIEIITCAATHGYLPLLLTDISVNAQVSIGVEAYKRRFGRQPNGIWLPECAYRPSYEWLPPVDEFKGEPVKRRGVEEILSDNGLKYFVTDAHMLRGGKAIGVYLSRFEALKSLWEQFSTSYKPLELDVEKSPYESYIVSSGEEGKSTAVFVRDPETALQVWSGEWGYPGDGQYLDFHKKHFPGGHRYWRVTRSDADLAEKEPYHPELVDEIIRNQSEHFVGILKQALSTHYESTGKAGILTAPFDTELFGHWWFEGPEWIEAVLYRVAADPDIELTTLSEHHERTPAEVVVNLPEGSWGEGGFHYIWFNDWTDWTWKHIYEDEVKMSELALRLNWAEYEHVGRIMRQAARELLLLQSSDWQFLISTWSARDYAEARVATHHSNFQKLCELAEKANEGGNLTEGDWHFLSTCEGEDHLFKDIDLSLWSSPNK